MTTSRSIEDFLGLVREQCRLPRETEWVEREENNAEPTLIERSGLDEKSSASASRLIMEAATWCRRFERATLMLRG
jgi:hypothetical protein